MAKRLGPVSPGEILVHEFMEPLGLSQTHLARDLDIPPRRVNEICLAKRAVTIDTALRLARFFGTTPNFWLNLQLHYDLALAMDKLQPKIWHEVARLNIKHRKIHEEQWA